MRLLLAILLLPLSAFGIVVPAEYKAPWTNCGVVDANLLYTGRPNVTNIFTNFTSIATPAQINHALDICPSNQVVKLGAGTFSITSPLNIGNSNGTVLRGSGPDSTILVSSVASTPDATISIGNHGTGFFWSSSGNSGCSGYTVGHEVSWTAGFSQFANQITVSSASGLVVGQIIGLDQKADEVNVSSQGCRGNGASCWANRGAGTNVLQEYKIITAINGTVLTIDPPLCSPFWAGVQSPKVFWADSVNSQMIGLESLSISNKSAGKFAVCVVNTHNWWIYDVVMRDPGEALLGTTFCTHGEVNHCTFADFPAGNSGKYGAELINMSTFRFENNIFSNYFNAVNLVACDCAVVMGNFFYNDLGVGGGESWNMFPHVGHTTFILWEANFCRDQVMDCLYGNSTYNTTLRNRFTAANYGGSDDGYALRRMSLNKKWCVAGNLLGMVGQAGTTRESATQDNTIISYRDGDGSSDSRTADTASTNWIYAGNWDSVTNAVVWGPTNTPAVIETSLAYNAAPSWWGNRPWPGFDTNSVSAAGLSPTNIPAGYRFTFGADPPAGGGGGGGGSTTNSVAISGAVTLSGTIKVAQ